MSCCAISIFLLVGGAICVPIANTGQTSTDIRLIIDNDPGFEDYIGMLMVLQWPRVKVEALTIVPGVIPDPYVAATNELKFLEYISRQDIPVAVGMKKPLKGQVFFPKDESDRYVHFWDNYPTPKQKIVETNAVDVIVSKIMSSPGEITLVAAGPLTNVAAAIMKEPQIVNNVKRIVIMGGTTLPHVDDTSYVPGTSHVAEFNIFTDPEAASIVFGSGAEITMVGLNVTVKLFLTPDLLRQMSQLKNRATHLLEPMLAHTSLTPLWDTMTMSISIDPYLVTTQRSHVQVVLGGNDRGRTLVSEDKNGNVDVSLDVDGDRLQGLILELLAKYGGTTTQSVVTSSSRATESTPVAPSPTAFEVRDAMVAALGLVALVSLCFLVVGMIFFARRTRRRATISPQSGMICHRCGVQNKLGAAFCRACGMSLPSSMRGICWSCRTTNKATASFCRRCGTRLR